MHVCHFLVEVFPVQLSCTEQNAALFCTSFYKNVRDELASKFDAGNFLVQVSWNVTTVISKEFQRSVRGAEIAGLDKNGQSGRAGQLQEWTIQSAVVDPAGQQLQLQLEFV